MHPLPAETFDAWFARQNFRFFKADELTWYFRKVRNGARNTEPPRELWGNIVPTLRLLDRLRAHFDKPLTITSTYRALAYNRAIGSPDGSMHRKFNAVDFIISGVPPKDIASVLHAWRRNGSFTGGVGTYPNFVHLDTRSYNATW